MKYKISISDNNNFLYIRVNEPVTEDLLEAFLSDTAEKSSELGINRFLFDLRNASNNAGLGTHYQYAYERSKQLGFKLFSRHALLINPADRDSYDFVRTVLNNASYQSKIFEEEESAIKWLDE